ncbi:hypothetical protein ACFLWS_07095 [Chloroflexota bacterium]
MTSICKEVKWKVGKMKMAEEKTKEELIIHERSKGKSLRQLGQMFNTSHESVRQLLAKYDRSQVTLLPEQRVAAKLGYPVAWLIQLRIEGIIKPIKRGFWLYSEEQVRQIPSLIAEIRKCEQCGKPRPRGSQRLCGECRQYRKKQRNLAWRGTQR